MAKTVQTICVTLEPKYIEILQRIKREQKRESMSATIRFLLDLNEQMEVQAKWEKSYDEYYSDPKNVQREKKLTKEMLQLARVERKPAFARASSGKRGAR